MDANTIKELITREDNGENLEVKIETRISRGHDEPAGTILVQRVKTPDYIRIVRIYEVSHSRQNISTDLVRRK